MNLNENIKEKMCLHCNKKLRPINTGSKHYHSDWTSRKFHKSCYKKRCDEQNLKELFLHYGFENLAK